MNALTKVKAKGSKLLTVMSCAAMAMTMMAVNACAEGEWDTFFRKHRHIGYDVILIPQSKKLIARKVLEYCEFEVKHYNRKHQGTLGWIFSLFLGSLFSYSTCWRGTKDKPLEQGFFTYKPRLIRGVQPKYNTIKDDYNVKCKKGALSVMW